MRSFPNFLFTTSAAGFLGLPTGHLAGKNIQCRYCHKLLEEPQHALVVLFIPFSNLLTPVQGHMELEASPSRHWVEAWIHC